MTRGGRLRAGRLAGAAALAAAAISGGCSHDYATRPRVAVADGDPIVQMTPAHEFETVVDPRMVVLKDHTDPPFKNEQTVGVPFADPARMYPVGLLDDHEVVNDAAAGTPYVVARCALTNLSTVLDRRVAGRTLTLENSGAVWRDMLVMRDKETGTYWTPATGKALSGPLLGETLKVLPAPVTTAEAWRELYPSTVCFETGALTAVSLKLRAYAASGTEGVSGGKTADKRFPPKETVFFVAGEREAMAFLPAVVREKKKLDATLDGAAVTIEWDGALRVPRAWRQVVAARQELPAVPIYWFALVEQFETIRVAP